MPNKIIPGGLMPQHFSEIFFGKFFGRYRSTPQLFDPPVGGVAGADQFAKVRVPRENFRPQPQRLHQMLGKREKRG